MEEAYGGELYRYRPSARQFVDLTSFGAVLEGCLQRRGWDLERLANEVSRCGFRVEASMLEYLMFDNARPLLVEGFGPALKRALEPTEEGASSLAYAVVWW